MLKNILKKLFSRGATSLSEIADKYKNADGFINSVLSAYRLEEISETLVEDRIKEADKIFRQIIL